MLLNNRKFNKVIYQNFNNIEEAWLIIRNFSDKKELFDYLKPCKNFKKKTYEIEAIHKAMREFKKLN